MLTSQHLRLNFSIPRANFSAASGLSSDQIRTRIFNVMEGFEKVDAGKLQESSSFATDLGLDSLDAVEVVMAIEEEFGIEIPDEDADSIQTVQQAKTLELLQVANNGTNGEEKPREH
ncbi:hypothetical protein Clacol_003835 [Clathrus columnatus]|uniref:Acyl carrier protein n=1 Tax=Clathrus columnatus TaxID=1419009 RepID=A0AAV5A7X4_9AGAM|nr:hypothetical protein Clacol_003835 [Clathrus columnatus]